jgi:hypothetical protein
MIKTINYTIILAVVIILSCQGERDKVNEKSSFNESTSSSHLGAWEMIYFQSIRGTDTIKLSSNGTPLAITLMTPSHFSYQWRNSSNSGAGTYTYDGKIIHQEFKYVQDSNFVGAILSFNMDVRNDSLIFSGPIKAVSSTGKNLLNQIPQMVEIRRRAE